MIGQTLSHYRILEKLGEGGMGIVYRAEDIKLKRTVALKFLPRGLEAHEPEQARFLQEAQSAAALNHPNICTIHDIAGEGDSRDAGQQFIVMEYVDGKTLTKMIPIQKKQDAVSYAIQIGEALEEAHKNGIVHRDIKADNIMVNSKNQIKVMDFGLAKLKGALKLTKASSTVGTLAYMAPEQIQGGEVDARSDIFSFGVVLFEMLTGHLPFRGEHEAALMYSILNEEPESLQMHQPDAPSELLHVLNRSLEKDPEERYQNVHEMLIDLRRLRKETSRVSRPVPMVQPAEDDRKAARRTWETFPRWSKRASVVLGSVAALIILIVAVRFLIIEFGTPSDPIPIAVITFENQTGEAQYDYLRTAIPNLLTTSLEQSTALRVTTWERMRDLLKQMGKANAEVITADLGFELCRQDSVRALVTGSFVKMGDMFATDVKVLDVESKALLKSASSKGEGVGSILKVQIDELGKQIATGIGLPEAQVVQEQKPITDVTTTSMQAYNYFVHGRQHVERLYHVDARRLLEKAIQLDSTFAMAHFYLAYVYSSLGETKLRRSAFENAMKYTERTTRKERLIIESGYARSILGDRQKQYKLLKLLEREFPKDKMVHYALSFFPQEDSISQLEQATSLDPTFEMAAIMLGYAYARRGEYSRAIEVLERYAKASPGNANPFDTMGEIYFWMGNLDESIRKYKEAVDIKPDWGAHSRIAYIYAVQEDYKEALRWNEKHLSEMKSASEQYEARIWRCFYERWLGSNTLALQEVPAILDLARKTSNQEWEATTYSLRANILVERKQFDAARNAIKEANRLAKADFPANAAYYDAFFALIGAEVDLLEGRIASAGKALSEASSTLPKLSGVYSVWLTFLIHQVQGELLMAQGMYGEVIRHEKLRSPLPEQSLSTNNMIWINLNFRSDRLAKAYVAKGDLDSAVVEYERITKFNPADKDRRLINPLHRYELAKLYEKKGLKEKAVEQYEKFLSRWKDADKELPEPPDARKRLARLMGNK